MNTALLVPTAMRRHEFVSDFGALALSIVGMIRASRREWWRYPVNIRFVRGARPSE